MSVVHLNCRLSDILTSESINKNKFLNVSPNPFFYIQKTQNTMSYIFNMIISYHSKILKQVIIVTHILNTTVLSSTTIYYIVKSPTLHVPKSCTVCAGRCTNVHNVCMFAPHWYNGAQKSLLLNQNKLS